MKTRLGKIAQLPQSIRDDLNRRLQNGHQGPDLLRWLNSLAKTKKLLAKKFGSQPITKSNLSHWRRGGFQDWRQDQSREARIQRICESGDSSEHTAIGDLFENFARIAVAELMADFDSLQKLPGEDRSRNLHQLVRDLASVQNSFNRSRWAELAWEKWNDHFDNETNHDTPATPEIENVTPCSPTSVVPSSPQSQAGKSHDSSPPYDPIKVIHHTRCGCGEPCPTCHASDSEYPLDEVLRDQQFYNKHGRQPYDRHGHPKYLMNCDCDCFCDHCVEKNPPLPRLTISADIDGSVNGDVNNGVALPRDPVIHHTEARDENPAIISNPQPSPNPIGPTNPISQSEAEDFSRRMAHLKSTHQ